MKEVGVELRNAVGLVETETGRRTDMERLTERLENGAINVKYASQHETAIHRLAAIEDILGDEYDLDRLKEAVKLIDKLERK